MSNITATRTGPAAKPRRVGRKANLRQLLLRASRILNAEIVDGLVQHGFELRSTHTALLSNLDEQGTMLSTIARRAGMSKQAMGRLADELESLAYIKSSAHPDDRRSRMISFTAAGWELMRASFESLTDIERRYAKRMGRAQLESLRHSLELFIVASDSDSLPLSDD
jgi:DNA-binding MarR family transcriptional regulator